jgi:hypothetical protein
MTLTSPILRILAMGRPSARAGIRGIFLIGKKLTDKKNCRHYSTNQEPAGNAGPLLRLASHRHPNRKGER